MQLSTTESSISSCDSGPSSESEIATLRRDIDRLDETLAMTLMQRYFLSQKVQELKRAEGQNSYSPTRESQIISKLNLLFPMIPRSTLENIYTEIFNWMRPKD